MTLHINNLEKLEDMLSKDISWRKAEILKYRVEITGIEASEQIVNYRLRSAIVMLYANWEGFIRNAANYYVVYVFDQGLQLKQLTKGFWTIDLYNDFQLIFQSKKKMLQSQFLDELFIKIENDKHKNFIDKEDKRFINTNSNLNYDRFQDIIKVIELKNEFNLTQNMIDTNLLKNRNFIAHGERTFLNKEDTLEVIDYVLNIMEEFSLEIINAAESEAYKVN